MDHQTRNTKVVICLILAMTAGARALLWLEPGTRSTAHLSPLTAAGGMPVTGIVIEYASPGEDRSADADCLILADGRCVWSPRGPSVRVVVQGHGSEQEALPDQQKQGLLSALASMLCGRDTQEVPVSLAAASDVRLDPLLPRQAHELCELLVAKGLVP